MILCAEMHCWPEASKDAEAIFLAASLMLASAKTMFAALDPSSAKNFLAPAAFAKASPAMVPPVRVTAMTSGFETSSCAGNLSPVTTLNKPLGIPALWKISATRSEILCAAG